MKPKPLPRILKWPWRLFNNLCEVAYLQADVACGAAQIRLSTVLGTAIRNTK
jgi:hypothetical protein